MLFSWLESAITMASIKARINRQFRLELPESDQVVHLIWLFVAFCLLFAS